MKHILDSQKQNLTILSLINWLGKVFEEEISKRIDNKLISQKAVRYILLTLSVNDGVSQNDIVRSTFLKGSTISLALNKMEKAGIVARVPDTYDQRQVRVYLTDSGEQLKLKIDEIMADINKVALENISDKDEKIAFDVVYKMINNFNKWKKRYTVLYISF